MLNLRNKKKDNKGFTLVELVVVIAILAILVGLLVPQYTKYVERSRKAADASNLENMVRAVEITAADATESIDAGIYTITMKDTDDVTVTPSAPSGGTAPAATTVTNALEKVLGVNYDQTRLKSKKWKEITGASNEISAIITVDTEGGTTIEYVPNELKELVNNFNKKATPTPTNP